MNRQWMAGIVVVLSAGLMTLPLIAQDFSQGQNRSAQLFRKADSNGDRKVTLDELKAVLPGMTQERFAVLDRNGDGTLTQEDLRSANTGIGADAENAWSTGQVLHRFRQADKNGDRQITFDEAKAAFPQVTQERFRKLDRNGDGILSKEDRSTADGIGAVGGGQLLTKLKQADTNGDQKITFEEAKTVFPQATQERFSRFDRNGDGMISHEDVQQTVAEKFRQADNNKDGKVSFEEMKMVFPRVTQVIFKRLDRNGDGFLGIEDKNM